jgi:hypothetical protein
MGVISPATDRMAKVHSVDGWCQRRRGVKLPLDPWLVLVRRAAGATAAEITGSSWPPATGSHRGSTRRVASTLAAQPVATSRSQPADTILLVEDDLDIAQMYRLKLQNDGYRVHVAMTGEMALAVAFQARADLVSWTWDFRPSTGSRS